MYLAALARGDADAALALVKNKPDDTRFLTDEVLARQLENAPITDVQVQDAGNGAVDVTATFGFETSTERLTLTPPTDDAGWKLDDGAVVVGVIDSPPSAASLLDGAQLFGKPVPERGKAYVFPGWIEIGTSNPYLKFTEMFGLAPLLNGLTGTGDVNLNAQFAPTEAGRKAALDAVNGRLADCAKERTLQPPNCPQSLTVPGFVDGTVNWGTMRNNGIEVESTLDQMKGTVLFAGSVDFEGVVLELKEGGTRTIPTVHWGVYGRADLTQTPPTISLAE